MDRERKTEPLRQRSALEKGLGLAYLVVIIGATVLALPLTGVISYEEPGPQECVQGYSGCLEPGVSDYDCEGEGDGPQYVEGPIKVTGSDPFDLDPDDDGYGCD